jgi:hypothetical protein
MPAFKKNNPGCCACATCSNLPDTLYLADDPKSRPSGSTTPAKVPFIYDAGAGLWVCAVTVYNVNIGGTAALGTCTGSGAFTTYVYQMNASFLLTVQSEACKLNSSTLAPLRLSRRHGRAIPGTPGHLPGMRALRLGTREVHGLRMSAQPAGIMGGSVLPAGPSALGSDCVHGINPT